ncbi:MAG: hypothetical protein R2771_07940 [Saprospiraceae bacterium]
METNIFEDSKIFYQYTANDMKFGNQISKGSDIVIPTNNSVLLFGFDSISADSIRKELYETSYIFNNVDIYDIGNIKNVEESEVFDFFTRISNLKINYIALGIINENIEKILGQIKSGFLNVSFIEKSGTIFLNDALKKLFENSEFINKTKLMCYQTHLIDYSLMSNNVFKNSMRLCEFRNSYKKIEPILRDVDYCFFNLDSIRYSEIPGMPKTSPSGLTSEEACQITKYLGLNPKNNFLTIFGYQSKFDFHSQGAMLVSQMIWYYLEGLDQRIIEDLYNPSFIQTYMVDLSDYKLTLKFVQSKKTGRWWVEIPLHGENQSYLMPCSEEDYDLAIQNELSIRIFDELGL